MSRSRATLAPLDRERFGIEVARWDDARADGLEEALGFCRDHDVSLLIARCDSTGIGAVHALEGAGARLMDTLVSFGRSLSPRDDQHGGAPTGDRPGPSRIRPASPDDAESLREIAAAAFRGYASHYHADPLLDRAHVEEIYPDWAFRSCQSDDLADAVLVAENNGRVTGFLTLQCTGDDTERHAEIRLNAVVPTAQRQGVYAALLGASMEWAREGGCARILVSTQLVNRAVQAAWVRAGFEPLGSLYTFHLWIDRDWPDRG